MSLYEPCREPFGQPAYAGCGQGMFAGGAQPLQVHVLEQDNATLRCEVQCLVGQLRDARQQAAQAEAYYEEEVEDLRRAISEHRRESERVSQGCKDLVDKVHQNKATVAKLQAQNAELNLRVAETEKDKAVAAALAAAQDPDARLRQLEGALDDRNRLVEAAHEQAEQLALDSAVLGARQQQLEQESAALRREARAAHDEVDGLRGQRAALLRQLSEVTATVLGAEGAEAVVLAKKKSCDNRVKKAEKKAHDARVQAEALETHCEELEGARSRLAADHAALDQAHATASRRACFETRGLLAAVVAQLLALAWAYL